MVKTGFNRLCPRLRRRTCLIVKKSIVQFISHPCIELTIFLWFLQQKQLEKNYKNNVEIKLYYYYYYYFSLLLKERRRYATLSSVVANVCDLHRS